MKHPTESKQMPDEQTPTPTPDQTGITRTADGTIAQTPADQSSQNTTPPKTPEAKASLLNDEGGEQGKKDGEESKKPDAKKDGEGAPATYADFTLPEGYKLDDAVKTEVSGLFKEMNLSQEQGQKLIDFYVKNTQEAFTQPFKAWEDMNDQWREQAAEHPELRGKLGPGKEVNVTIAKAYASLENPELVAEFKNVMDLTGAGNHPAFIRMFYNMAKRLTEGTHVSGNGPTKDSQSAPGDKSPPSAAGALWPKLPSAADRR
jgi:hypothetical protein